MRVDAQPDLARLHAQLVHEGGRERRHRQRGRVDAQQQVQHRHVADDHRLVGLCGRDAGLAIELAEDGVHGRDDGLLELVDRLRPIHAVADSGDHVGAERRLAVERREHGCGHPGAQVHQRAHERGRPDVERHAVALAGRVARLDGDEIFAREHGRDLEPRLAKHLRQRAQHGHPRLHVVALHRQGVTQARDVAPLVFHRWLLELEVDLAHVRVEDDQAPKAHGGCLRDTQQLRHLAGHVLVDPRLAREPPSLLDLLGTELAMVRRLRIREPVDDAHLAFAARAAAAAGGIDGQADPVRGGKHRRTRRDARGPVKRLVSDLELARDHVSSALRAGGDVPLTRSAR